MKPLSLAFARALVVVILVAGGFAAAPSPAAAAKAGCPLCKDAKSDTDYAGGTASLPNGFYYSIVFMVCAPFAVIATLAARIVLARRRLVLMNAKAALPGAAAPHEPGGAGIFPDRTGSPL